MFVGDEHQADSKEERKENHLEHADILPEGEEDVLGHDIHQGLERTALAHLVDGVGAPRHFGHVGGLEIGADFGGERGPGLEHVDHHQANADGKDRGDEVDPDGAPAHAREFAHIGQRGDAGDEGREHQGHRDQLEEIDEERAEGCHPVPSEIGEPRGRREETESCAQAKANQDLPMEFHLGSPPRLPFQRLGEA